MNNNIYFIHHINKCKKFYKTHFKHGAEDETGILILHLCEEI